MLKQAVHPTYPVGPASPLEKIVMTALKSHEQLLLERIGAIEEVNLVGKLTVGQHGPNTTEQPGEYMATLNGITGVVDGSVDVYFDRIDPAAAMDAKSITALVVRGSSAEHTFFTAALRDLGINIKDSDIVAGTYTAMEPGVISLPIAEDSLLFTGEVDVTFLPSLEGQEGVALVNTPGVELYPVDTVAPATEEVVQALAPNETTPTGTFLVGTGIPSTHLIQASNAELTMSFGVREHQKAPTQDPVGNMYEHALPANGDWGFLWSIALHGDVAQNNLLDMYDVTMSWTKLDTDETLTLRAVPGEGRIDWEPLDKLWRIVDGNLSNSVTQNSQRLRWYAKTEQGGYFTKTDVLSAKDTMVGEFAFAINAVRKNTAEHITLDLYATASISEIVEEEEPT